MIYRDFQDVKLSALGMGAMRLPVVDGDDSNIDEAAAFAMVDEAMARGVNYYDTAWAVSYTHLDVYKRQGQGGRHPFAVPGPGRVAGRRDLRLW